MCDKNNEWQLRILEHRKDWIGRSGRGFDQVYICQLDPKEIGLTVYVISECKAGFVTSREMDEFYQKFINEPEFRNRSTDEHESNVITVILGKRTAESSAFQKS